MILKQLFLYRACEGIPQLMKKSLQQLDWTLLDVINKGCRILDHIFSFVYIVLMKPQF